jgi:pimeloyl-ACP methyl ester carboxylesterase
MIVASRSLAPVATELCRRGFAVWVPDLPGFGRSQRPRRALGVNGLADAVAAWISTLGVQPCAVVGNSFGTQVAAALVQRHPGVATRLALVAPTIDAHLRRWAVPRLLPAPEDPPGQLAAVSDGAARRALRGLLIPEDAIDGGEHPSLRSLILSEYALVGPARVLSTYRWALVDDLEARMAAIHVPVLVARGSQDGLVSPEWAARLAGRTPKGRYREMADVDHDAEFKAPVTVADTLEPFLRGEAPDKAR